MVTRVDVKTARNEYPPLFWIKDAGLSRYVSQKVKEALESAEIKGLCFVPVD